MPSIAIDANIQYEYLWNHMNIYGFTMNIDGSLTTWNHADLTPPSVGICSLSGPGRIQGDPPLDSPVFKPYKQARACALAWSKEERGLLNAMDQNFQKGHADGNGLKEIW